MTRWILASASPRRRELLLQMGIREFEIHPAKGEESSTAADPGVYVEELARRKAAEVFRCVMEDLCPEGSRAWDAAGECPKTLTSDVSDTSSAKITHGNHEMLYQTGGYAGLSDSLSGGESREDHVCIIGADTIVVCGGRILGKPRDRGDAAEMIRLLQGRAHEVMTGVSVYWNEGRNEDRNEDRKSADAAGAPDPRAEGDLSRHSAENGTEHARILQHPDSAQQRTASVTFHVVTRVQVAVMEEEEIQRYLATGEADDKAGAYGIQGAFGTFIEGIEGDYYNVVGLPIARLYQVLKRNGLINCPGS